MRLCGIAGKSGAGKTEYAKHAIGIFGGTKVALGDAVKEEVGAFITSCGLTYEPRHLWGSQADRAELLSMNVAQWMLSDYRPRAVLSKYTTWDTPTRISISYRQLLQTWGTEYRRAQSGSYWCDKGRDKARSIDGLVFIDDIRFPDEAQMIKDEGGILVRIERPGGPRIKECGHASEVSLDAYTGFDVTIINAGDLTDLHETAEAILRLVI